MTGSSRPESIRVHLSIRHGTAAHVVLASCETPSARRAAAQNLMQSAAAVLLTGRADTPIAMALAMPSSSKPASHTVVESTKESYASEMPSAADAIFDIDFDAL